MYHPWLSKQLLIFLFKNLLNIYIKCNINLKVFYPIYSNFIFSNDDSVGEYKPVNLPFYKCSDNPHTGEGVCPCMHCDQSCAPGEVKNIEKSLPKYNGRKKKREIGFDESEVLESYLNDMVMESLDYRTDLSNDYCIFDQNCR